MNTSRKIIAIAALALAGATANSAGKTEGEEARLARMLVGRTAGEPMACIPAPKNGRLEVIDGVAIVYTSGNMIYVARPTDPTVLDSEDILVIERFGGQLCNSDIVRTINRQSGYLTGVVFMGKFVPYRKQD